jgi:osmotically-inducible protein OsmY
MANVVSKLSIELNDKLSRDKRTADAKIEVIDHHGVITLTGTVTSNRTRAAATLIVFSHPSVVGVINDIIVDDPDETVEIAAILPLSSEISYPN